MQVHFGDDSLRAEWPEAVACVGTFDGVHLGHQEVIRTAVCKARELDLPCVLVTFDRHPAAVLAPDKNPQTVSSLQDNLAAFEQFGVSVTLILTFDFALSQMSAGDFLQVILRERVKATSIVVGHDFAMGHDRVGTTAWLSEHIPTTVVPPFEVDGARVSSSDIRRAVVSGDMALATALLGRPFRVNGVVVGGQKLGRTIGYPTINIARSFDQVTPADGVYAGTAGTPFGSFMAAISIGVRPAVGGDSRTIEAYLLDYPGEALYGQSVVLDVHERLREERDFPSLDALTEQIAKDVEQTRAPRTPSPSGG